MNRKSEECCCRPFCRTYWCISSYKRKDPTQCFSLIGLISSLFAAPSLILWMMKGVHALWFSQFFFLKKCPLCCSNSILKVISIEVCLVVHGCSTNIVFLRVWQQAGSLHSGPPSIQPRGTWLQPWWSKLYLWWWLTVKSTARTSSSWAPVLFQMPCISGNR